MNEGVRLGGYSNLEREHEAEKLQQSDSMASPTTSPSEPNQATNISLCKRLLTWRKYLILVLTPIILMPVPIAIPGTVCTS